MLTWSLEAVTAQVADAVRLRHDATAVERVDKQRPGTMESNQKVPWERHPGRRETSPARYQQVDQAERDGGSLSALKHPVDRQVIDDPPMQIVRTEELCDELTMTNIQQLCVATGEAELDVQPLNERACARRQAAT